MSPRRWSYVLQWSRLGASALVFLVAARFLTLYEIGAFAVAFAPVRLAQGLHKAGIVEATIILDTAATKRNALFALSITLGLAVTLSLSIAAFFAPDPMSTLLLALCIIPTLHGLSAVSEGLLRKDMAMRSLAIRTCVAQISAALMAFLALASGGGVMALVIYAITNAVLNCVLSLFLARWIPTGWPTLTTVWSVVPCVAHIAGRDAANTALLPLTQIAVSFAFGLSAAGAFQIATRMLGLVDALTLSPLRYLALPEFRASTLPLSQSFPDLMKRTLTLGAWAWFGLLAAASDVLILAVGAPHAPAATPILMCIVPLGLIAAVTMPVTQALTAHSATGLVFKRAVLNLILGLTLAAGSAWTNPIVAACALSLAAVLVTLWYLRAALPCLDLSVGSLRPAFPPFLAGLSMAMLLVSLAPLWSDWTVAARLTAKVAVGTVFYFGILSLLQTPSRLKSNP